MRISDLPSGRGFRIALVSLLLIPLAGCGATALVGGAATVTGQAVKTTGKAAGTAARATIGGVRAAGSFVARPFRKREDDRGEER
ncbi:MAG: hypothetical protein D6773_08850 [Alphaproteobacteria bacterium]|nr:MAG: hypothetical protein D6773_08850 [Alphaproteobacteria bacterium]